VTANANPAKNNRPIAWSDQRLKDQVVDHLLRTVLIQEVHARFVAIEPPEHASHLAFVSGQEAIAEDFAHLVRLCQCFGVPVPTPGARHFSFDFGLF
jgi:hypothetical protein